MQQHYTDVLFRPLFIRNHVTGLDDCGLKKIMSYRPMQVPKILAGAGDGGRVHHAHVLVIKGHFWLAEKHERQGEPVHDLVVCLHLCNLRSRDSDSGYFWYDDER